MNDPLFLKIIVVGDSGVGKTSFLNQYCYGNFNKNPNPTIGCDFSMKILSNYEGKSLRLQLWDIAGQERFHSVSKLYVRGAVGCLIVADCTSEETLSAALRWKEVVEENCDLMEGQAIPILLMQNKLDRLDELGQIQPFQTPEFLKDFAKKHNFIGAYQVSAKSDTNLKESMDTLLKSILSRNMIKKQGEDNFAPSASSRNADKPTNSDSTKHRLTVGPKQPSSKNAAGACC